MICPECSNAEVVEGRADIPFLAYTEHDLMLAVAAPDLPVLGCSRCELVWVPPGAAGEKAFEDGVLAALRQLPRPEDDSLKLARGFGRVLGNVRRAVSTAAGNVYREAR